MNNIPCVGDIVYKRIMKGPERTLAEDAIRKGTIIYVHPKFHYYTAEFDLKDGKVREAFEISPAIRNRFKILFGETYINQIERV